MATQLQGGAGSLTLMKEDDTIEGEASDNI